MNRKIPSYIAIGIIAVFAILAAVYAYKCYLWNPDQIQARSVTVKPVRMDNEELPADNADDDCAFHAYSGNQEIGAWISDDKNEVVEVSSNDLNKMPAHTIEKLKLIDLDPTTRKALEEASKENPAKIKITGVMTRCADVSLACLNYRDGIFKPYI